MRQRFCVRGWSSNKNVVQEQESPRTGARMQHPGCGRRQNWVMCCRHGLWSLSRAGCEPGERGLWCVWKMAEIRISWSSVVAQYNKLASARIWCSLKIWPTKGQIPVWESGWTCVTRYSLDHLLFVLLLQSLQNHYHPDVAKAAAVLNQSLSEIEDDISGLLELSGYEVALLCLCEWLEPGERRLVPGRNSRVLFISPAAGEGAGLTFGYPDPGKTGKCLLSNGAWGSSGDRDGLYIKGLLLDLLRG